MPTDIKMPQLGESVTEGTIGKWLKQPGERVEKYEALLEVTTDKVDTEVPSPISGIVREIAVPEGATVRVGTLLAVLDDDRAQNIERRAQSDQVLMENGNGQRSNAQALERSNAFISPVVARLAAEHQLDLGKISGSGQGGRVTKQDVLRFIEARKDEPSRLPERTRRTAKPRTEPDVGMTHTPAPAAAARSAPDVDRMAAQSVDREQEIPEDAEIIPVSPMRRSIAEHMVRSRRTAPHVTSVFEVDVSQIVAHRERRKAEFEQQGVKLTYTPYFVQAAVVALQAVPSVNGSYAESGIVVHQRIHIGVAVALDEGLIVPVLRDADEKNLLGLARAVNDLSERARARRLKPDETQGGTFTITNHGVGGSLFATPIINQPQAAILGIGAIQKRAVVISQGGGDAIAIRPMCYLSLTIDHRLLDGATADRFLAAMKEFLESYAE
ncbi:MAG TPA: dihydrolipoamide acetyltransferase family protein [Roseiflexaceae bacterium]|nr:dihydrolipoamide acetyltransferase family protein [Roseiflexaceae bacterium]